MSMIHEADNTLIKLLTLVTQSPPWGHIINIMPDVNLRPYLFMYTEENMIRMILC